MARDFDKVIHRLSMLRQIGVKSVTFTDGDVASAEFYAITESEALSLLSSQDKAMMTMASEEELEKMNQARMEELLYGSS